MVKRRIFRFIFMLSFVPYALSLLLGVEGAVFGERFLGDTLYYGWDGFLLGMVGAYVRFVMKAPVLPVCLFYQIVYIFVKWRERKRNGNNSFFRR